MQASTEALSKRAARAFVERAAAMTSSRFRTRIKGASALACMLFL